MMLPSSLLASLFVLASPGLAVAIPDDGLWHPSGYTATTTTAAEASIQTVATSIATAPDKVATGTSTPKGTKVETTAATAAVTAVQATGDWQQAVTWPAGCESWANPCPSGAHISGGGVAGYTNGFTSYLTLTNSDGIITGMPEVATVAAGVSAKAAAATTLATSAGNSSVVTPTGPSRTQSGFSAGTSSALSTNAAPRAVAGGSILAIVAAVVIALL